MNWGEWGRLTRFHESSRLALARERRLWSELELANANAAVIRVTSGERTFQASVAQHREAIADEALLNVSILVYSYALAEAAVEDLLRNPSLSGIERWGEAALVRAGRSWGQVEGGRSGASEVAVVRNLIAHGETSYTQQALERVIAAGKAPTWAVGDPLRVGYEDVLSYRARLKSLLRKAKL
jgi:hypothetical protein